MDYVTADLHFGHKGLLRYPERKQFKTIEEHDEYIIRRLNSALKPSDTLYVLGDLGFYSGNNGTIEDLARKVKRIECARKIFVYGNHDHFTKAEALDILGFDEVHRGPMYYEDYDAPGKIILSHEPVKEAYYNPYVINVHGHIHNYELKLPGYYNVNIARCNFSPVPMRQFVNISRALKSRREKFGEEWYYDAYIFPEGEDK